MPIIPATIDEVTAEWVAEATGLAVTGFEAEIIGVGIGVSSAVYRLKLEGADVPETLVLKLRAIADEAAFTSSTLMFYQREIGFFDELAKRSPITVPTGYGGAVSEDGQTYYLFMEDMGGNRIIDQNEGMSIEDAERAIDALAQWHAEFWGDAEKFVESGAALRIDHPVYEAVLPLVFAEGWEKVQAEMEVLPTIADVAPRYVEKLPDMLKALSTAPTTVVHGDYRGDNMMFDDNGDLIMLDFQITGLATPAYDLAYFVTQSLTAEMAAEHEAGLFDRYIEALVAAGVDRSETERIWQDYRVAGLFCLVYPIVASRGMDLSDQRQYDLVANMSAGCARVIDAHDLRSLL